MLRIMLEYVGLDSVLNRAEESTRLHVDGWLSSVDHILHWSRLADRRIVVEERERVLDTTFFDGHVDVACKIQIKNRAPHLNDTSTVDYMR